MLYITEICYGRDHDTSMVGCTAAWNTIKL